MSGLDPRKAECFGLYGYGNGWFIKEGSIAAKAASRMGAPPPAAFCNHCPKKQECWDEHKRLMEVAQPDRVMAFVAAMDQAKAGGMSAGEYAARQAAAGNADPWFAGMMENFQRGAQDRADAERVS